MIDFARAKIVFALAMAGILFAIHPLIRDHGTAGFEFFGVILQFQVLYYTFLGLLACTVYFYAVDLLNESPMGLASRIANLFYALAVLFPPVFGVVALSITVAEAIVWISDSPLAGEVSKIAIVMITASTGLLIARKLSLRMSQRERAASADQLAIQARGHLRRADELVAAEHYDLVALEAFRAIEATLQHGLLETKSPIPSSRANLLIPAAAKAQLIPEELVGVFHELRIARNRAVHGAEQFDEKDASWFLATTRNMIKRITLPTKTEPDEDPALETAAEPA